MSRNAETRMVLGVCRYLTGCSWLSSRELT
jgi:hypothetical protein